MRGISLRWACVCAALLLLVGPATGAALAVGKPFVAPVVAEVTRKFDAPSHKFGPGHRGIDYGVPPGTTVRGSGEGTVTFAGQVADDGLFVTIEHLGGISTTYSYLSQIDVSKGDHVTQGQAIALSGEGHAGGSAGLHFGAKKNGDYIDPEMLLLKLDDITDILALVPAQNHSFGGEVKFGHFTHGLSDVVEMPEFSHDSPTSTGEISAPTSVKSVPSTQLPDLPQGSDFRTFAVRPSGVRATSSALLPTSRGGIEDLELAPAETGLAGSQESMAKWWRSQSPEFRKELIAENPQEWARKQFVSAADRNAINRFLLEQRLRELERYRASAAGKREIFLNDAKVGLRAAAAPFTVLSKFDREAEIDRKIRTAKALLAQLESVSNERRNLLGDEDVYLLDFDIDFAGGDGKAVVALGDPGTADHIGVLVPGINNAVGTIKGGIDDAAMLRAEVEAIYGKQLMNRTSTILWMGYDNPNGLPDAASKGEAQMGAPWLKSFVNGLRDGHVDKPSSPHITVFGHSFGSTVTGIAALDGMVADDIVFFGSPGVGRHFVDADDFSQRIWAARSWLDPIVLTLFALGSDPASLDFGAGKVGVNPFIGHSGYIARGSEATVNFAKILVDRLKHVPKENR
jgi:hypothetical protein